MLCCVGGPQVVLYVATPCLSPRHASVHAMPQSTPCLSPRHASVHAMPQSTPCLSPRNVAAFIQGLISWNQNANGNTSQATGDVCLAHWRHHRWQFVCIAAPHNYRRRSIALFAPPALWQRNYDNV